MGARPRLLLRGAAVKSPFQAKTDLYKQPRNLHFRKARGLR